METDPKKIIGYVEPFYESMTAARDPNGTAKIRVWRKEEKMPEYADEELIGVINAIPANSTMAEVFDIIGAVPRVTAIELTDKDGIGVVKYFEW